MADENESLKRLHEESSINKKIGESQRFIEGILKAHHTENTTKYDALEKKYIDLKEAYDRLNGRADSFGRFLDNNQEIIKSLIRKLGEAELKQRKDELTEQLRKTGEDVQTNLTYLRQEIAKTFKEMEEEKTRFIKETNEQARIEVETTIVNVRENAIAAEKPAIKEELEIIVKREADAAKKGIKKTGLWLGAGMATIALIASFFALSSAKSARMSASYESQALDKKIRLIDYKINEEMGARKSLEKGIIDLEEVSNIKFKDLGKKFENEAAARKSEMGNGLTNLEDKIGKNIDARTKGLEVQITQKVSATQYQDGLGRLSEAQQKLSEYCSTLEKKYDDALKRLDLTISGTSKKEDYLALRKILDDYKKELASYNSGIDGLRQNDERTEKNYNDAAGRLKVIEEKLKEVNEEIEKLKKTD